jgi:hypothetical protein
VLSVHFCFGRAPHMGQRTDNICPNLSFRGSTPRLSNKKPFKDGQFCSPDSTCTHGARFLRKPKFGSPRVQG